jgi:CheY-like chemotaxis protein
MGNANTVSISTSEASQPAGSDEETPVGLPAIDTLVGKKRLRRPALLSADVLVVEDDDTIRTQLAEILRAEGHSVVTAGNGQEALDRLDDLRVGVVILDLMMPVMSGWEFERALRKLPGCRHTPLLVITAASYVHRAPPAPIFVKPLNLDSLLRAVHLHLGHRC